MTIKEVKVPDLGGAASVDVIDILVKAGDTITKEQSILVLEGDKASMEVPSPLEGTVKEIKVKVGDKVSENNLLLTVETSDTSATKPQQQEKKSPPKEETKIQQDKTSELQLIKVPDLGGAKDVEVIELLVKPGDVIKKESSLITLESEKASMDVPSPFNGIVKQVKVALGDKVNEGDAILEIQTEEATTSEKLASQKPQPQTLETPAKTKTITETAPNDKTIISNESIHAGPAVRRLAREFGIELQQVKGSGDKGRIVKQDVQSYVKTILTTRTSNTNSGFAFPPMPKIDFTKFGEVEIKSLSKIKRLTGVNTHRSWVTIPHVTQFDEADITDLEQFRNEKKAEAEKQGYKLTPLVFLMKAVVKCLQQMPNFNSSLDESGENLILKHYFNIGVAVDTPNGLVVPVINNVDQKGLFQLSKELADISKKAREKGLTLNEMSGSCFTISSLGGIGGTAFTPIINSPDVAILGVSKSQTKPKWNGKEFQPRLMLPLSLSYDHRVIDGAEAARFVTLLGNFLSDIRGLLL